MRGTITLVENAFTVFVLQVEGDAGEVLRVPMEARSLREMVAGQGYEHPAELVGCEVSVTGEGEETTVVFAEDGEGERL